MHPYERSNESKEIASEYSEEIQKICNQISNSPVFTLSRNIKKTLKSLSLPIERMNVFKELPKIEFSGITSINDHISKSFPNIKNRLDISKDSSEHNFKELMEKLAQIEYPRRKYLPIQKTDNSNNKDRYLLEKIKGGKNSYKKYHALKAKVLEICKHEMEIKYYKSAKKLCEAVAWIIENNYPQLLECFYPYQESKSSASDWRYPSFYNWCNTNYKKLTKIQI